MIPVEDVKKSMRIGHNLSDDEIQRNIETALLDMSRVGVNVDKKNQLVDKACELYCKAQFDYQGKGESYLKNYEKLRDGMSMSGEHSV